MIGSWSGVIPGQLLLTLASSLFAAAAVLGWLRRPDARRLRRSARPAESPPPVPIWARTGRSPGWRGVLRGRLDAPALSRRLVVASIGTASLGTLIAAAGQLPGPLVLALVPVAATGTTIGLGLLEPAATRRRQQRLVMDCPQSLDLLAACLAAGLPPRNATDAVVAVFDGPLAEDLGAVSRAVEVGLSDAMAWRTLRGHPQLGEAALDLARAVESGSRLVETLTYYAAQARQRRAAAVETAAKAVGVRCVVPMMICFMPSFLLLGVVPTVVSAFLAAVPRVF